MKLTFEETVLKDLAELKVHMHILVGNGQPGTIATMQKRILMLTIGLVALALSVFGPQALAWVMP